MSKWLSLFMGMIVLIWFFNFDQEEYLEEKKRTPLPPLSNLPGPEPRGLIPAPEREAMSLSGTKLAFPLGNKSLDDVISGYGDPRANGRRIHKGIDIPADRGTPVLAVADGVITKVAEKGNAGKQIWLKAGNKKFFYAHLDSWTVTEGQSVKQGEQLGTVGNTGNARHTLPHLHFGVYIGRGKTIDPATLFSPKAESKEANDRGNPPVAV